MANGWLLLTFGDDRQYGGNSGYADDPSALYRYDSLVPNSRRIAAGDVVILRDREAMLGVAVIEEISSRAATKMLRRCPQCSTTKFGERRGREPRFRCKQGHEFAEPVQDPRECEEFTARFGRSFRPAADALSIEDLRAACPRYTDQLSMQAIDLALVLPALHRAGVPVSHLSSPHASRSGGFGAPYRQADESAGVEGRDPFQIDPQVVERGNRGHAATQNALAAFLRENGVEPRSPETGEPEYDLAWCRDATVFVAEVKSLTDSNEEKQLRLGLGQVLRYRHLVQGGDHSSVVVAVLAVEREPQDGGWASLCLHLGIVLVWPGQFARVLGAGREAEPPSTVQSAPTV